MRKVLRQVLLIFIPISFVSCTKGTDTPSPKDTTTKPVTENNNFPEI